MNDEEIIRILEHYGDLCIDRREIPNVEGNQSYMVTATLFADEKDATAWVHTTYGDETQSAVKELYDVLRFDVWVEIGN